MSGYTTSSFHTRIRFYRRNNRDFASRLLSDSFLSILTIQVQLLVSLVLLTIRTWPSSLGFANLTTFITSKIKSTQMNMKTELQTKQQLIHNKVFKPSRKHHPQP